MHGLFFGADNCDFGAIFVTTIIQFGYCPKIIQFGTRNYKALRNRNAIQSGAYRPRLLFSELIADYRYRVLFLLKYVFLPVAVSYRYPHRITVTVTGYRFLP